jgi:DNA-binding IclR family transcriptional regulator
MRSALEMQRSQQEEAEKFRKTYEKTWCSEREKHQQEVSELQCAQQRVQGACVCMNKRPSTCTCTCICVRVGAQRLTSCVHCPGVFYVSSERADRLESEVASYRRDSTKQSEWQEQLLAERQGPIPGPRGNGLVA